MRGLMDSGHFGCLRWLALLLLGATLAVTCFDSEISIRISKRLARWNCRKVSIPLMSVATSKASSSQEFDWLAWDVLGARVAGCVELPFFPIITASVTSVIDNCFTLNNQTGKLK